MRLHPTAIAKRAKDFLREQNIGLLLITFALGLGILLLSGPELQSYSFSVLKADQPSIYEAANGQAVTYFPKFADWIFSWAVPIYSALALVALTLVVSVESKFKFTVALGLSTALILTIMDIIVYFFLPDKNASMLNNVVANLIGGQIASFIFVGVGGSSRYIAVKLNTSTALEDICTGVLFVFFCVIITFATYTIMKILFDTLPVNVVVQTDIGTSGMVGVAEKDKSRPHKFTSPFKGFFPTSSASMGFDYTGNGGRFLWRNVANDVRYRAQVDTLIDCPGKSVRELPRPIAEVDMSGIKSLDIRYTGSASSLKMNPDPGTSVSLSLKEASLNFFWINSAKNKTFESELFVSDGDKISGSLSGGFVLLVDEFTIEAGRDRKRTRPQPRTFRMLSNGRVLFEQTVMPPELSANGRLNCQATDPRRNDQRALQETLRIRMTELPNDRSILEDDPEQVELAPRGGWVTADGIKSADFKDTSFGDVGFFSVDKNIEKLVADGEPVAVNGTEPIWVYGDTGVSINSEKKMIWRGTADALWVDGRRRNKTIWETLPAWSKEAPYLPRSGGLLPLWTGPPQPLPQAVGEMRYWSRNDRIFRLRLGCFSFRSAFASICRMRSRVTLNCCPTSSSV